MAERLGVTPAAVGQYETGVSKPRPDLLPSPRRPLPRARSRDGRQSGT
ncbi:helix-turn-helix domain-containing protein [Streptomyces sp. NPDC001502]